MYTESDADHWYKMYNILLDEISEAKAELPDARMVILTEQPAEDKTSYVDNQLFVHNVKQSKYSVLEPYDR